jgi:predicted dehydrogenase
MRTDLSKLQALSTRSAQQEGARYVGRTLNIAYVGYGKSANRYHIPYVRMRENFKITRVVTLHPGKRPGEQVAQEAMGTQFSSNLTDILNDTSIDLVVVVTPADSHYALVKELLLAGKNVLCDKPLVEHLKEARELVGLADDENCFLMPFQNRRFDSDYLTVKKVLATGVLGEMLDIEVTMDRYRPAHGVTSGGRVDGSWYGHGVHLADQMVALFGKPAGVQYDVRATRVAGSSIDDYFSVNLLYSRLRATVAASELAVVSRPKWTLYGSRGTFIKACVDQQENDLKMSIMPSADGFGLDAPQDFGRLVYYNQDGDRIERAVPTVAGDYGRVYDSIYETLVNGAPKLVSDDEMLTVIELLATGFN